jgi:deazaflavin-dependent oxidoreductase (nitroreductase family)
VSIQDDFNARVIEEFRANEGRVGGIFDGQPLLLLHHTGARSGTQRVTPLAYLEDGGRWVIFGSKAGAPTHPDWYHNLRAHPDVLIEVGTETVPVTASVESGAERERLFALQAARVPQFAGYGESARSEGREIPVIVLTRRAAGS